MFPAPNPFLQLTPPRVARALARLGEMTWENPRPVAVSFAGARATAIPFAQARRLAFQPLTLPHAWGRLFETGWFHLRFPPAADRRPRYLHWHDQGEGTLFLTDLPWCGFDVAHRHARLPDDAGEGWVEGLCLQSAIWHPEATGTGPHGSELTAASVVHRNDDAWRAHHRLAVLHDLAQHVAKPSPDSPGLRLQGSGHRRPLDNAPVLLRRLLRIMDDAVNALDQGGPAAMLAVLDAAGPVLRRSPMPIRAVLTGHAHLDLVWLWPEACAAFKARHTFATINRLLDDYPEMRFSCSQAACYEAVQRDCPALMDAVRRRVRQGAWEPVGASYVEMDTLLPCGEALVRALLVGRQAFRELLDAASRTLWLPDSFGFAGCLPQVMRQCGVDNFFTTKLTWSSINRFPCSSFVWRGTDGSEVLAHLTHELGYHQQATPSEGRAAAHAYLQSDVHDAFLQPVGFGDGGGGVTPEMCERARLLERLAGVPETGWGTIDGFFADLERARDRLPRYQGELYLEYHRGTFTTHGDVKAACRGLERALQVEEAARALLGSGPPPDPHAWKRLLFSHFHDYVPGSSIREVYAEGLPELHALAAAALGRASAALGTGPALFNPLPLPRTECVAEDGRLALVTVPPLAAVHPGDLPRRAATPPSAAGLSLRSDRLHASFNTAGEVTALVVDGHPVPLREPLNQLWLHPDHPHRFPAWDIDRQTLSLGTRLDTPATQQPCACGPAAAATSFRRAIGTASELTLTYRLDARHPVLLVELELDWNERDALLRALFPTACLGRLARFGSPFNSVLRGQQPGDPRDEAMFEGAASRWAVVMDDNQSAGLLLVTEAKYGMGCRDGCLGLSLVRSVPVSGEPGARFGALPEANRPLTGRDPHSDRCRHSIRYAIGRFAADLPRAGSPAALADLLYTPALPAARTGHAGLLDIDGGASLVPAWAKPLAGGGWVLRLHETLGRAGQAQLRLAPGWHATRTRLAEDQRQPVTGPFAFRPYEIVSLIIAPAGPA